MYQMEYFLSKLPHLKYLELKTKGLVDLFDGYRWQVLTKSLIIFNFKFFRTHLPIETTLASFHTPFWLEEKRWFVVYDDTCLFTVSYFVSDGITLSEQLNIRSTISDNTYLYNYKFIP